MGAVGRRAGPGRYRPVADLVVELCAANRIGTLVADDETVIEAALDVSYQAVSPAAQRQFRLLGVIPGEEFSAAATAATLSDTGLAAVQALLDRLATAHEIGEPARDRFAFHDPLRRHAGNRSTAQHTAAECGSGQTPGGCEVPPVSRSLLIMV